MKVVKKINNNVAVCIDSKGRELIAFGKGIGFPKTPYEIHDLSAIERTYYSVKQDMLLLLQEIDESVFDATTVIFDKIRRTIKADINDSLYFVLVDHFSFAIKRARNNLYFLMKIKNEIFSLYETEVELGRWAIRYLNHKFNIRLLDDEAAVIALHIIQNIDDPKINKKVQHEADTVQRITEIVEDCMEIKINRESFNYSRFVTHLQYLFKRQNQNSTIRSENTIIFEQLKQEFPKVYECVNEIKKFEKEIFNFDLNDEELLYLMLHINRMISR